MAAGTALTLTRYLPFVSAVGLYHATISALPEHHRDAICAAYSAVDKSFTLHITKPTSGLKTTGVHRYIRHPGALDWAMLVYAIFITSAEFLTGVGQEEEFLRKTFGDEYVE
ncbi:hypothetical protein BDW74DRAFT_178833 [Aspergillus multicolor]|uniref:uncharacterized protein n=1 Tax=Aspergillus multicolor TaxID=41759 RepID=UPI003CCD2A5D